MAKIQRYQSSTKLSTEGQGVQANPAVAGAAGREVAVAGQALQAVGEKFHKLNAQSEVNDATSRSMAELNQLELDAQKDPDLHKNVGAYQKRAEEIRKKYSSVISDPTTRAEFDTQLSSQLMTTMTKLTIDGRKQGLQNYRGSVFNYSEMLRKRYMTADESKMGDAQRMIALGQLREAYQKGVKTGAYTPEEAAKEVAQFEKQAKIGRAMYDIEQGVLPWAKVSDKLDKNEYEIDDPQTLIHLKNLNESVKNKRAAEAEAALKQTQLKNQQDFFNAIQAADRGEAPMPTVEQAMAMEAAGELTTTASNSLVQYLVSKDKVNAKDVPAEYAKLHAEYSALDLDKEGNIQGSLDKIATFRQHVLEAAARGVITDSKMQDFLKQVGGAFDTGLTKEIKNNYANRVKGSGFLGLWVDHHIKDADMPQAKMILSEQLMKKIDEAEAEGPVDDKQLSEILNGLIKSYIKAEDPALAHLEEPPNAQVKGGSLQSVSYTTPKTKANWIYDPAQGKIVKVEVKAEAGSGDEKKKPEKKEPAK